MDQWKYKDKAHRVLLAGLGVALLACHIGAASAPAGADASRFLIIAPEAFHQALGDFVTHKSGLRPTRLHSLERILRESPGADDPEKLKRFLYEQWRGPGLAYVLLVGDVDVMPVRYMVLDRITPAAFDYAFYPSDLYYSDLAKADGSFDDWNAVKDSFHAGYFGEVRGEKNKTEPINFDQVDYLPDIAVGRWPVSTPDEARRLAAKTVAYETSVIAGQSPAARRAAFFAVDGWVDSRKLLDRLANRLEGGWHVQKRFYSDSARTYDTPPPSRVELRTLFNQGLGLAVHTGHGQPDSWEKCFSVRDLDRITNTALPVVVSVGCSTAYFAPLPPYDGYLDASGGEHQGTDHGEVFKNPPPPPAPYQRGRFNPTGLGEQVLKRGMQGGVAYIGCNTGSQPCALTLLEGFLDALADAREQPCLGDCWAQAIRHYYEKERLANLKPSEGWYPPSIFFQGMKFMVFGDPSLRLPANQP